jgi:hypothetical protein
MTSAETKTAIESLHERLLATKEPFGEVVTPPQREPGVLYMPYVAYGDLASELMEISYGEAEGFMVTDERWTDWCQGDRGRVLMSRPEAISRATEREASLVLTTAIRSDRFSDGALLSAMESGIVTAALGRIAELRREARAAGPEGA